MVVGQRQRRHQPRAKPDFAENGHHAGPRHAQNRHFRRVDDGRERGAADAAKARDRERAALHLVRRQLAVSGLAGQLLEGPRQAGDVEPVGVADHRHQQSAFGVCGEPKVHEFLQRQRRAALGQRRVHRRELLQAQHGGARHEGQQRQAHAVGGQFGLQRLAPCLDVGDVGLVVLGHVRDVDPARPEPRPRNLLDPPQRDHFDLSVRGKIDFRDLRQPGAGRAALQRQLDPGLDVGLADPALDPRSGDRGQVHAQFAGELAHRGRRVRFGEAFLVDGRQGPGRGRKLLGRRGRGRRNRGLRCGRSGGRWTGRRIRRRRRGFVRFRRSRGLAFQLGDHVALIDRIAHPNLQAHHAPVERRGHVHCRLFRFQRDQRVVGRDLLAGGHRDLDDFHIGELAQAGHANLGNFGHVSGEIRA